MSQEDITILSGSTSEQRNTRRRLMACGLNAHRQLNHSTTNNLPSFQCIAQEEKFGDVRVLFTSWCTTILLVHDSIVGLGHQKIEQTLATGLGASIKMAFGTDDTMHGFIDDDGNVYCKNRYGQFDCVSTEESHKLDQIAWAAVGGPVIAIKQTPAGPMCNILAFKSFDQFLAWILDPSSVQLDNFNQRFMFRGRLKQIVAGCSNFLVLMESGEVYSWGDARYKSLGRSITAKKAIPAEKPGLIEALGGLKIIKIATLGWICAALSADRALYLWGTDLTSADDNIPFLADATADELVLVEIPAENGDTLDVVDVGIGAGHIVLLVADGRLFVIGDNRNGQLGVSNEGKRIKFVRSWNEVPNLGFVHSVLCGHESTFAFTNC